MIGRLRFKSTDSYLDKVIKYIPSEIHAFYLFAAGIIASAENNQQAYFNYTLIFILLVAPFWIWFGVSSDNPGVRSKTKIFHAIIAEVAILIWVYNISMEWLSAFFGDKLPCDPIAGSLILAAFTILAPLLEKIVIGDPLS